jgi:molecular chaperone GrpE (heat shock protein)
MSQAFEIEADFAAVMQQLSAEAAIPPSAKEESSGVTPSGAEILELTSAVCLLSQRIEVLEGSFVRKFEALQFQKLEEQLAAIRDTETVNQKLFDSLHKELLSYRDNFVRESLQKPFIRDLLILFDDLSAIAGQFEDAAAADDAGSEGAQSSVNLKNTLHFLLEILHRLEVTEIEPKETVDRTLHRVISYEVADSAEEDGRIVRRVRTGFTWHDRVLRPEEVIAYQFQYRHLPVPHWRQ